MSILFDTPPAESLNELNRAAGRIGSGAQGLPGMPQLAQIDPAGAIRLQPHGIYFSSITDAAAGKAVANAKLVAWRYLMQDAAGRQFAVEVNFNQSTNVHAFSQVSVGPRAASIHTVLEAAEKGGFGLAKGTDYKVRVLRIPSLYVAAVWFYSGSDTDRIIPLASSKLGNDVSETVFTVKAFDALMTKQAKARLAMSNDSPR